MEKKHTAVQKLIEHLEETYHLTEETRNEFNQALQMEREQIEEAYKQGDEDGYHSTESMADYEIEGRSNYLASNYYTQTFKP